MKIIQIVSYILYDDKKTIGVLQTNIVHHLNYLSKNYALFINTNYGNVFHKNNIFLPLKNRN